MLGRALVVAVVATQPLFAQTTALTHVNVVDVNSGTMARDQTVLISQGRITAVGPTATLAVPGGATTREFRDRFVIPGLWDMHTHLGAAGRSAFALYLATGVTGVRDMGSDRTLVRAWRDSIAAGAFPAPRLIAAGPIVEREGWLRAVRGMAFKTGDSAMMHDMGERIPISTPASAIVAVDSIIRLAGDFLKIRNDPSPDATFAMLRYAREKKLDVAGHWPSRISPEQASDSGYRSLEHGPLSVAPNGALAPTFDRMTTDERRQLYMRFVKNRTAYTPTIVSLKGGRLMPQRDVALLLADTAGAVDPRMRYVSAQMLRAWKAEFELLKQETGAPLDWAAFNRSFNRDLREMADMGVLLLAGTDVGAPLVFPGFSLADELELMVTEGNLTSLQALRTATLNVSKWMNAESDFGSVAVGRRADLVVLEADPLTSIANVRRVAAVVRDGRLFDRAALDRLLASARR